MKINLIDYPWKHFIIEDFLPQDLFELTKNIFNLKYNNIKKWTYSPNRFGMDVDKECPILAKYLESLIPLFINECTNLLKERNLPLTPKSYKRVETKFCIDKPGYSIEKHNDIMEKCITFVIYINGKGSCTSLFESKNDNICIDNIIIPNSALVFVPKTNITFHSVKPTNEEKHTIQMTLRLK
jgi:hypothetical protein